MARTKVTRDFRRDGAGHPIAGGTATLIANRTINDSDWKPIKMSSNQACKQYLVRERDSEVWKMSMVADGSVYFTVSGSIAKETSRVPGDLLFYAQMASGSGTLEFQFDD